ncbi:DUF1254 domain-containing protein [Nocardioides dubius]|uniref:DUF1254 domain-containing protein n=1 Tax=Nocardioides dubius TaxID=317019 RepID=A0ABP4EJW3_9ACTN
MSTDQSAILGQAFVQGFPLVFNLEQVRRYVETGIGANPAAPFNAFSHARTLTGPADTFVSINNDTVYSMAQIDLSVGPVLLDVPDTGGRYYVLQFVDAWTNNFAYVGHRATGTAAQRYLLVPPGWSGAAPEGATVINAPTTIFSIVGRWACDGDDDLPAVHRLQDAASLTPVQAGAVPAGLPELDPAVDASVQFLEQLRVWSQAYPPAKSEQADLAALAPLGITQSGPSPFAGMAAEQRTALAHGVQTAQAALEEFLRTGDVPTLNGWQLTYHAFDYNTDFFEIGTIDSPLYTSIPAGEKYLRRAAAAMGGLWGNHAYEAAYAPVYVDQAGEQLSGEHTYTLRFDPPPPAAAFWSLTMYSMPDFYLVANEIDRYSIGSRTPGLVRDADGALTLVLSATAPTDPAQRANWLPAPAGPFRPLLRMYEPDPSVVDGRYQIPAIVRV